MRGVVVPGRGRGGGGGRAARRTPGGAPRGRRAAARRRRPGRRASPPRGRPAAPAGRARGRPARSVAPRSLRRAQRVGQRLLVGQVDAGGRLVEEEQVGLAGQRAGDQRALLLAAGEGGDAVAALGRRARPPRGRRRWRPGRPATAGAAAGAGSAGRRRPPPTPRRVRRRRRRRAAGTKPTGDQSSKSANGVPKRRSVAGGERQQAGQGADQRGLAGAVGAHQRHELAGLDRSGRCRAGPGGRRSRPQPCGQTASGTGSGIRWPPRGRRGWLASARGSPRRRSSSLSPSIGSRTAVRTPRSSGERVGQLRAGQPLGEDRGDALARGSAAGAGPGRPASARRRG